ncbi:VCBS repeat-containing protein [Clostridium hydrogeniformans]|uniref:VCBS repeat-containing protein n=1 Tax=Clostridium hydrogeniformans TaxID=349933 RepID=UPI000AA3FEB7|nr:VCBS repeat-containing protein [Clostridium hydrogeniformans]
MEYTNLEEFLVRGEDMPKPIVIDVRMGDVTGDKVYDRVMLVGSKPYGKNSPFVNNMYVVVFNSKTKKYIKVPLKNDVGYNPRLFLGDFTGDGVLDIWVSVDSGGSGGFAYYDLFTYDGDGFKNIFNNDIFNTRSRFKVEYMDNYVVRVYGGNNEKSYLIDIRDKDPEYLNEIYNSDGTLKAKLSGDVTPLNRAYPVDFESDGVYDIYAIQRITGRYNADEIGLVNNALKWDESYFQDFTENVSIFGSNLGEKE